MGVEIVGSSSGNAGVDGGQGSLSISNDIVGKDCGGGAGATGNDIVGTGFGSGDGSTGSGAADVLDSNSGLRDFILVGGGDKESVVSGVKITPKGVIYTIKNSFWEICEGILLWFS